VVGQEFTPDPVALGQPALSLLDVIPVVQHATAEISYLRQTTRTNNAAVVAAGALKPTSVYSVTRVESSLQVIAHLSEGIPRHWLLDNTALEAFLANELTYGLQTAVEAKVLADVNGTSGIQMQAYATSVLATLRKGVTSSRWPGTPQARSRCTRPTGKVSSSRCRARMPLSTKGFRMIRRRGGCSGCPS
jgi:HK97 family phage major capsid protein